MDDRDRMDRDRMDYRTPWVPWAITSVALVVVAFLAYSLGARQEAASAATGAPLRVWHFGFFPGIFGIFLLFWIFGCLRRMWWGGCGYPYYGGPWRYRRYYGHPHDDERDFEEWHRRAHDRVEGRRSQGGSSPAGTERGPIT